MHAEYRCPCGTEHGHQTDHPQTEKLCTGHLSGTGYRGTPPVYAKGYEAPEAFADFLAEQEQRDAMAATLAAPASLVPEPEPEPAKKSKARR